MKGILYGVGVGPGDPELITLKAINKIKQSDIIAVPQSGKGDIVALNIVKEVLPEISEKEIVELSMPMTRNKEQLQKSHLEASEKVQALLDEGKDVAFLTLGDPTIYSTYIYVHNNVIKNGYDAEIVPGVPSFCAVAAKLNMSLVENSESLHIIPASYKGVDEALKWDGTKVLMKTGKAFEVVKNKLRDNDLYSNAKMVQKCGMEGEQIFNSLDETNEEHSYFSIIVAKEKEC